MRERISATGVRPEPDDLRADARRNRCRILEAAETVFAEKGPQASTEEVAAAASVGIGTVFRHFPTKAALLEGVYLGKLRRLVDEAESLSTSEDPDAALYEFFTRMVAGSRSKRAFSDALAEAGVDLQSATAELKKEFGKSVGKLLANAQRGGTVRKDVSVPELMALISGAFHAAEHGTDCSETAGRVIGIIFDGLRADRGTEASAPRRARRSPA